MSKVSERQLQRTVGSWVGSHGAVVVAYIALCAAWEGVTRVLQVPEYILPPPSAVAYRLVTSPSQLATHASITLLEVVAGFALAVVVSLPLGFLIVSSRFLMRLIYPLLVAFQAVPKVALAPILVLWFGFGPNSKILLGFATAMFPILVNTVLGLNQTPAEVVHLMRSLGASPLQTFLKIRLFLAAPSIFSGFKVGITLGVVGVVVGEFIASNNGLGYLLLVANNSFNTALLFAVVVVLSLMSVALFYIVELVEIALLPRPLRRNGRDLGLRDRA